MNGAQQQAFVCGFGDPATGVGGLAWDLGEPGALLLSEGEVSAATFALEEGGDAATLEITAGERTVEATVSPRTAELPLGDAGGLTVVACTAEVDRKDGSQSFQCPGQISRWSADPLEGAGTFRHLAIDAGDQSLIVVESRGEPGAEHGEERTAAWLVQGEDESSFEERLRLDPVRRRGQSEPPRPRALARGGGAREPRRGHQGRGLIRGRDRTRRRLGRLLPLPDRRRRGPRQLSALARMSEGAPSGARSNPFDAGPITTVISDFGGVLTTPLIQSFAAVQDRDGDAVRGAGQGDGEDRGGGRSPPPLRARDGEAQRGRLPPPPRRGARAGPGPPAGAPPLPRDLLRRAPSERADDRTDARGARSAATAWAC